MNAAGIAVAFLGGALICGAVVIGYLQMFADVAGFVIRTVVG